MTTLTPYSGSLLRLALTTVAILAAFAVGWTLFQQAIGLDRHSSSGLGRPSLSIKR